MYLYLKYFSKYLYLYLNTLVGKVFVIVFVFLKDKCICICIEIHFHVFDPMSELCNFWHLSTIATLHTSASLPAWRTTGVSWCSPNPYTSYSWRRKSLDTSSDDIWSFFSSHRLWSADSFMFWLTDRFLPSYTCIGKCSKYSLRDLPSPLSKAKAHLWLPPNVLADSILLSVYLC